MNNIIEPPDLTIPPDLTKFNTDDIKANTIQYLRNQRNKLLKDTDIYLLPDFPISTENKQLIISYRQSLRDFPTSDYFINYDWSDINNPPLLPINPIN